MDAATALHEGFDWLGVWLLRMILVRRFVLEDFVHNEFVWDFISICVGDSKNVEPQTSWFFFERLGLRNATNVNKFFGSIQLNFDDAILDERRRISNDRVAVGRGHAECVSKNRTICG